MNEQSLIELNKGDQAKVITILLQGKKLQVAKMCILKHCRMNSILEKFFHFTIRNFLAFMVRE